jgi:hypothetical protein
LIAVGTKYPYLIKTFVYNTEEYTVVELLVFGRPKEAFNVWVPADQNVLNIVTTLPRWFFKSNQMMRGTQGGSTNEVFV